MRALDKGRAFIVTRNGVPVGELMPLRSRTFVGAEAAATAFASAPAMARSRLRKDIDAIVDQDSAPRA